MIEFHADNVGKTFVAACLASWFYDSFNPSQTLCTAPTKASVRKCGGKSQGRSREVRPAFSRTRALPSA
jgi:hypothetical protein